MEVGQKKTPQERLGGLVHQINSKPLLRSLVATSFIIFVCALFFKINNEYKNTMIFSFHVVCLIIYELSLPAWQKAARDIAREVVQAMKEAKNI